MGLIEKEKTGFTEEQLRPEWTEEQLRPKWTEGMDKRNGQQQMDKRNGQAGLIFLALKKTFFYKRLCRFYRQKHR